MNRLSDAGFSLWWLNLRFVAPKQSYLRVFFSVLSCWSRFHHCFLLIYQFMVLHPFVGPWPLFLSFLIIYTVDRTSWAGDQLLAHRTSSTQNKRTQTPMPLMGFEPTAPVFKRAKTVHTLDRGATVFGTISCLGGLRTVKPVFSPSNS
jgi:hypothetical protein